MDKISTDISRIALEEKFINTEEIRGLSIEEKILEKLTETYEGDNNSLRIFEENKRIYVAMPKMY